MNDRLNVVVERLLLDDRFLRRFRRNPDRALEAFDLTGEEADAVKRGNAEQLIGLGLDPSYVWPQERDGFLHAWLVRHAKRLTPAVLLAAFLLPATPAVGARRATAPDPLLAALVHLFLPQRHALLERVDRVPAGGERVLAMGSRHGDHDRSLADPDPPDPVVDGDRAELVARLQLGGDVGHHLLRHPFVGLVLQVRHRPAAGVDAGRADERRDRAGSVGGDLLHHGLESERLFRQPKRTAGDGRDQRHLVAVAQRSVARNVDLVHRVEDTRGLVAQVESRPDVRNRLHAVELALGPPRALA